MATKQTQDIDLGLTRNEYGDTGRPQHAFLTIATDKGYRGITSDAQVMWHGAHSRQHAFGLGGGGDFSKVITVNKTARATQRVIDSQHGLTFTPEVIAALTAEALAYYADGKDKR